MIYLFSLLQDTYLNGAICRKCKQTMDMNRSESTVGFKWAVKPSEVEPAGFYFIIHNILTSWRKTKFVSFGIFISFTVRFEVLVAFCFLRASNVLDRLYSSFLYVRSIIFILWNLKLKKCSIHYKLQTINLM